MKLKRVGFFRESHRDRRLPSLRTLVRDAPAEHEPEILAYLRAGVMVVASPGPAFDVLSDTRQIAGAQHLLTDGTWLWPADLAYYVERYHCELPPDFIEHLRTRNWSPPRESDLDLTSLEL